jgi:hypothetical protein
LHVYLSFLCPYFSIILSLKLTLTKIVSKLRIFYMLPSPHRPSSASSPISMDLNVCRRYRRRCPQSDLPPNGPNVCGSQPTSEKPSQGFGLIMLGLGIMMT